MPVALIKPSFFRFLPIGAPTRLKTLGITISFTIVAFVLFGLTSPSKDFNKEAVTTKQTKTAPTVIPKTQAVASPMLSPTPTPLDWIANPLCDKNADNFDACLREKYPLGATVKVDAFAIYITNPQTVPWTNCSIDLGETGYGMNGFDSFTVNPESMTRVPWGRLVDDNGNRFNYATTQPGAVYVSCVVSHELHSASYSGF